MFDNQHCLAPAANLLKSVLKQTHLQYYNNLKKD